MVIQDVKVGNPILLIEFGVARQGLYPSIDTEGERIEYQMEANSDVIR